MKFHGKILPLYQSKESWLSLTCWRSRSLQKTVVRWGWKIQGYQPSRLAPDVSHVFQGFELNFLLLKIFLARHSQPAPKKKNKLTWRALKCSGYKLRLRQVILYQHLTWKEIAPFGIVSRNGTWNMSQKKYPPKKESQNIYKMTPRSPGNHILTTMFSPKKNSGELCLANPKIAEKRDEGGKDKFPMLYLYILYIYI